MKTIIHLGKRWLKSSPGFTLAELMIAMAVGSLVMGGVFAVWYQLFSVTATNSNYMVAFRQVQNGGDWISHDALMTQGVYKMVSTPLNDGGDGIDDSQTDITVIDTDGFPPSGVICIEDELIRYISKTEDTFEDCTRGGDATAHDDNTSVTVLVTLNWTDWDGNQHQVVYNLKDSSKQLVRSYYMKEKAEEGEPENDFELQSSSIVAEAIDPAMTTSEWIEDDKELTVKITASVGGYVLGKHGVQSETATRTYKVNPRPLF